MDCFLIAHMIWDEAEQIEVVKGFVEDAIKNHAFETSFDLSLISKEVTKLEADIESQTRQKKKVSYWEPTPFLVDNDVFCEVEDPGNHIEGKRYGRSKSILITEESYLNLKRHHGIRVKFFNEEGEGIYSSYHTAELKENHKIILKKEQNYYHDGNPSKEFKIKSTKKTRIDIIVLTPPNTSIQLWNKKTRRLNQAVSKSLKSSGVIKKKIGKAKEENIFVNRTLFKVIEQSLDQAISNLKGEQTKIAILKDNL